MLITWSKNNNLSWKDRISELKEGDLVGVSIRWSDNEHTLKKRLVKYTKLGYFKYIGIKGNSFVYKRTAKNINIVDF